MQIKELKRMGWGIKLALAITGFVILIAAADYAHLLDQGQKAIDTEVYKSEMQLEARAFTAKLILEIESMKAETSGGSKDNEPDNGSRVFIANKTAVADNAGFQPDSALLVQLKNGYTKVLTEQKSEALKQLDDLIGEAMVEWADFQTKGEVDTKIKEALLSEYLAKVNVLETQMDASFEELLAKMSNQLESQGFDSEPIIKNYRIEYDRIKSESRNDLMSKTASAIKQL